MVKPDLLACTWVPYDRGARGRGTQALIIFPFDLNLVLSTVPLDRSGIFGLEDHLPGESKAIVEISHQHPLFGHEALARFRTQAC